MYLINDLEEQVLEIPYSQGYRSLRVLSGYVSPIFIEHVLERYPEIHLEVIVGMVSTDGLGVWHHRGFLDLLNRFPNHVDIFYQVERPGNHRKVYHWRGSNLEDRVFVGSANFTQNGFGRQKEILVEAIFSNIDDIFSDLNIIRCDSPDIGQQVRFYDVSPRHVVAPRTTLTVSENDRIEDNENRVVAALSTPTNTYTNYVDLSLLDRSGEVPSRSGLNWGQRGNRNPNQAYLAVSQSIHRTDPTFFPELAEPFLVITDDGEQLICVMAQERRKAIHTREDNSIMGSYFRRRLGLDNGAFVTVEDLNRYGRDSVRIYKIDDETYYLDFSR